MRTAVHFVVVASVAAGTLARLFPPIRFHFAGGDESNYEAKSLASQAAAAYRRAIELKSDYAEAALNLGIVLQEAGDADAALRAYGQAYRLRPALFGSIAMALTSASHGRLWLDEAALRRSLGG